jgi:hypothetical protein
VRLCVQGRFASLDAFQASYGDIQSASQVESLAAAIRPHILRRLKVWPGVPQLGGSAFAPMGPASLGALVGMACLN